MKKKKFGDSERCHPVILAGSNLMVEAILNVWAIMQFFNKTLTRQIYADCEASGSFYDFKLMQNNLTLLTNRLVK